jgi:hypothetical protein
VVVQLSTGKEILLKASTQFTTGVDYDAGKRKAFRQRQVDYESGAGCVKLPAGFIAIYKLAATQFLQSAFNLVVGRAVDYLEKSRNAPTTTRNVAKHLTGLCIFFLSLVMNRSDLHTNMVSSVTVPLAFALHRHFAQCLEERDWCGSVQGVHFWRHFITFSLVANPNDFDHVARSVYYEYSIIRFPALVLNRIRNPSVKTITSLVECVHVWMKAVEVHTAHRPLMMVSKRKMLLPVEGDDDDDVEGERVEREFRFHQLIAVPNLCT